MRERDSHPIARRRGKRRFDDEDDHHNIPARPPAEEEWQDRVPERWRLPVGDGQDTFDGPPEGDRWSTWDVSAAGERGPKPYPHWLVTDLGAVDTELGMLKTGKEADVFLLERAVPDTDRGCLLASKRYRSSEHRMFHRDAGYLEGRRVRRSRENRAMANRTSFGRQMIAAQWAQAEFGALCRLHEIGAPVPYPVQIVGTELLMEYIGDADGTAAPRLAQTRPDADELAGLWDQAVEATVTMARLGLAHGDLSPYNILVHRGRLVLIDLPQIVDVIANPQGPEFLARDARVVATWFAARGLPDTDSLPERLSKEAGLS
ncbi:MAG: phosphotransferase [Micromonosporaceae bacterium]|nr:phosphotransferase [Micromonosporaceae bacterium]